VNFAICVVAIAHWTITIAVCQFTTGFMWYSGMMSISLRCLVAVTQRVEEVTLLGKVKTSCECANSMNFTNCPNMVPKSAKVAGTLNVHPLDAVLQGELNSLTN